MDQHRRRRLEESHRTLGRLRGDPVDRCLEFHEVRRGLGYLGGRPGILIGMKRPRRSRSLCRDW